MNKRYNDLIKQGYQTTGIVSRGSWDKEEVVARMQHLKAMGNKVAVVQKIDVSPRRGSDEDKHRYWIGLLLKSEEYKTHETAELARMRKEYRERGLRKLADEITLEELAWMMKDKLDRMTMKELNNG